MPLKRPRSRGGFPSTIGALAAIFVPLAFAASWDRANLDAQASGASAPSATRIDLRGPDFDGRGLLALRSRTKIEAINLSRSSIKDDDLKHIATHSNLKSLDLSQTAVTAAGLAHLSALKKLEDLNLEGCVGIRSDDLASLLKTFLNLATLNLNGTGLEIGGATTQKMESVEALGLMNNLRSLSLQGCQLADITYSRMGKLSKLETLDLSGTSANDRNMVGIGKVGLVALNLAQTAITDEGVAKLPATLMTLDISGTVVSGKSAEKFRVMKSLVLLRVASTPLSNDDTALGELRAAMPDTIVCTEDIGDRNAQASDTPRAARLDLSGPGFGGKALSKLRSRTNIDEINLSHSWITDDDLKFLATVASLKSLDLSHSAVTAAGLAYLTALKKLEHLNLAGCPHMDGGIFVLLSAFPNLRSLNLDDTGIIVGDDDMQKVAGAAGMLAAMETAEPLAKLSGLRSLSLRNAKLAALTYSRLGKLSNLEALDLSGTGVTDENVKCLVNKNLIHLNLSDTPITDAGQNDLSHNLVTLDLTGTGISGKAAERLGAIHSLVWLRVGWTPLSGDATARDVLRAALPNTTISANGGSTVSERNTALESKYQPVRGQKDKPNHERIQAGLQWLADHQAPEGYWSSQHFCENSLRTKRGAKVTYNVDFRPGAGNDIGWESVDVGLSGLALLAFVGDGHTHVEGKFREHVKRGLKWMKSVQDSEGCFGARIGDEYVYNHAICAMSLAEIYMISGDPLLKQPAQRAVDFIVAAQNPGLGWRYGVKPRENDSSVTAWMVLALKSAKMAELKFPEEQVYRDANAWYDKVTQKGENGYLETGYNHPGVGCSRLDTAGDYQSTPSMGACCVMVRLFTHNKQVNDGTLTNQARRMLKTIPTWKQEWIDYYYWYYASQALFQMSDAYWNDWEKHLINPTLLKHQRGWHEKDVAAFGKDITKTGDGPDAGRWKLDEHGSWDPVDAWGTAGGRVYSTAINTLTLQVYYRYPRSWSTGK